MARRRSTTAVTALATLARSSSIGDDNLNRQYFTVSAHTVGPVFTRVWNTPDNGYAERFKHTIEPFLNIQRTTAIDDFNRIVKIDSIDSIVGSRRAIPTA